MKTEKLVNTQSTKPEQKLADLQQSGKKPSESRTKMLPTMKSPGADGFTGAGCKTFKQLIPIFLQYFQKTEKGTLSKTIYRARSRVVSRPETTQENCRATGRLK